MQVQNLVKSFFARFILFALKNKSCTEFSAQLYAEQGDTPH